MKPFSPIRRFFHTMVMLHKIAFVRHFNHARKRKRWRMYYIHRRAYGLTIQPNLVLLLGMVWATAGSDGHIQPTEQVWQSVVEYTLTGWAFLFMAIPILFDGTHTSLQREVRQELRERPRYWKRAMAVYWAAIVAAVVAVNAAFSHLKPEAASQKEEAVASLSRSNDFQDEIQGVLRYCVGDSIQADSLDMERARGTHAHSILPLLAELAHALNGSGETERMADGTGYCDIRYYLDVPGTAADSPQAEDTWITVDILSFDDSNPDIERCLNALRGKEYLAVETAQEAPEQCLVFTEGGRLIAVWCSLFRDGQEAVEKVKERLETFIVD